MNTRLIVYALFLFLFCSPFSVDAQKPGRSEKGLLGHGRAVRVADLPKGKFRTQLEKLPAKALEKALSKMETMSFHFSDAEMMRVDPKGGIYYECVFQPAPEAAQAEEAPLQKEPREARASVPISSPPVFHSKPGSTKKIYLDFNGHVITGTRWNSSRGVASWDCRPFDTDSDPTTFSDTEQYIIEDVWARVAEDYANFDIDVTTEEPTVWNRYVAHTLITPTTDAGGQPCPHNGSGGIAYVGVFGGASFGYDYSGEAYNPSWVTPQGGGSDYDNTADAASHEVGHNMGLNHDGHSGGAYYGGHGGTASAPSWGPIMGTGYGRNVSQWSKGEYYTANNTAQDDLAIIAGRVSFEPDDYGDTNATATTLPQVGVDVLADGLIETTGDVDVFSMLVGDGIIELALQTPRRPTGTWGGNLDASLLLYDGSGTLLASNNPLAAVTAGVSVAVSAGTYYAHVVPVGCGTPLVSGPSGYTVYGSVGTYSLSGTVPILAGAIVLLAPNGGSTLFQGATNSITWTAGFSGGVDIALYKGGVLDTVIATGVTGSSYPWVVSESQALGTDYRIRVSENADAGNFDESDGEFAILAVDLDAPDGGETFFQNGSTPITWVSSFTNTVDISLYKGGVLDSVIVAGADSSSGSYAWTIPNAQSEGTDYRIHISKTGSPLLFDESIADFSVITAEVLDPNGGESMYQGDSKTITWSAQFSDNVDIHLYRGGAQVDTIASGIANTGSYVWSIPVGQTAALTYQVRISKSGTPSDYDESDAYFSIKEPAVVLWSENFDGSGNLPTGWSELQVSGTATWTVQSGGQLGGSNPTAANSAPNNITLYDETTADDKNKLITPSFDCSAYGGIVLTFEHHMRIWSPDQDFLTVFYRTNSAAAWVQAGEYLSSVSPWTQQTVVIPASGNDFAIAFEGNAKWGYGVCLDDISVSGEPIIDPQPPMMASSSFVNVPEGGSAGFTLSLSEVPVGSVTVTVARVSGDTDLTVSGGSTLVFNSGNWSTGLPVSLAAAQDLDWTADSASIVCIDAGGGYSLTTVMATEIEDDTDPALLLPFTETFDGGGMASTPGPVNGQHAWTGGANALVQTGVGRSGSSALAVQNDSASHTFENGSNRVLVALWQKPVFGDDPESVSVDASAVFWVGTNGYVRAYSNTTIVTLPIQLTAGTWSSFEADVDYSGGTWSLYVDGAAAGLSLGLYSAKTNFTEVALVNAGSDPAYYDDIGVTNTTITGPGSFRFESATYAVSERGTNVLLSVRRFNGSDGAVSVSFSALDGSADGADYSVSSGSLNWADRETGVKTILATIIDDLSNEGDEDFSVSLSSPTGGASLGTPLSTTVTIIEDDIPPVAPSGLIATATDRFQIDLTWSDNSDNEDGFVIQRSLTGGSGFGTIGALGPNVTTYNDTTVSENTTYYYRVAATNTIGSSAYSSEANDTTPATQKGTLELSSATYNVGENVGSYAIIVKRTGGSDDVVSVDIGTSDGTATAGSQYESASTTLTWTDGDSSTKSLPVTINDNGIYEGNFTFLVGLSNAGGGASVGTSSATVTINEDDPVPAGARVIDQSPLANSAQLPGVTQVTMTFSEPIETNSFSLVDDVVSFTGAQGVDVSSQISGHSWASGDTELTVTFSALTVSASYRLVIGPHILNMAGWPMDQDLDGGLGELEEDGYAANIWVSSGGTDVTVWSDLLGADDTPDAWTLGGGWQIGTPSENGTTGPSAGADAGTNIIAQNLGGNYTANSKSYTETPDIDATGFTTVQLDFQEWKGLGKNDVAYVDVGYGAAWTRVFTLTGVAPSGVNDGGWGARNVDITANATNQVFRIRWGLDDTSQGNSGVDTGWQLDAIRVSGNASQGPPPLPVVTTHSPLGTVLESVSSLHVEFSQPMDTSSFTIGDDIASFTGPSGSITPSAYGWISTTLLRIDFAAQTQSGAYTLVFGPGLLDDWGQELDQDKDGTGNELTQDRYTAVFTIDTSGAVQAPSGLNAAAVSSSQVDLTWVDNASNETGHALQRSLTSGSGFVTVGMEAGNATNYSDSTVSAGVTYYYQVVATNASASSVPSAEASVTTPKLAATVILSNLTQGYNNTPRSVGVSPTPGGLITIVTYEGSSSAPTNAGSYTVIATVSDVAYEGGVTGILTIATAAIGVTADSVNKTVGAGDPSLTYSISSGQLFGSDSFVGTLSRAAGESSGYYAINQGTLSVNSNYALSFVSGTLTIFTSGGFVDADGDDMDDDWETTHLLSDPNADEDADGVSNHDEFYGGTDPNDGTKFLRILSLTIDGSGRPIITWNSDQDGSTPQRQYKVRRSEDLMSGPWPEIANGIPPNGSGSETGYTDTNAPAVKGLYRIQPY